MDNSGEMTPRVTEIIGRVWKERVRLAEERRKASGHDADRKKLSDTSTAKNRQLANMAHIYKTILRNELHYQNPEIHYKHRTVEIGDAPTPIIPKYVRLYHEGLVEAYNAKIAELTVQIGDGGVPLDQTGRPVELPPPPSLEDWCLRHMAARQAYVNGIWQAQTTVEETDMVIEDAQVGTGFASVDVDPASGHPRVMRIHPDNVQLDPDAKETLTSARWLAVKEVVPLPELRERNYEFADRLNDDDAVSTRGETLDASAPEVEQFRQVTLCHIYSKIGLGIGYAKDAKSLQEDLEREGYSPGALDGIEKVKDVHLVLTAKNWKVLHLDLEWPVKPDPGKFHAVILRMNRRDQFTWGYSDMTPALPALENLQWAVDTIARNAKTQKKLLIPHSKLGSNDITKLKRALESDSVAEVVPLNVKSLAPGEKPFEEVGLGVISPEILNAARMFETLWEKLVGITPAMLGEMQRQMRSSREAEIYQQSSARRLAPPVRETDIFYHEMVRLLDQISSQRVGREKVAELIGEENALFWIGPDEDEAITEAMQRECYGSPFRIVIESNSARKTSREQRVANLNRFVSMLSPMAQGMLSAGRSELAEEVIRAAGEATDRRDIEKTIAAVRLSGQQIAAGIAQPQGQPSQPRERGGPTMEQ